MQQAKKQDSLIVGGGSWATANIKMLTDNSVEKEIFWWMRSEKAAEHIQQFRHNPNYLSSVEIKVPAQNIFQLILKRLISKGRYRSAKCACRFFKRGT